MVSEPLGAATVQGDVPDVTSIHKETQMHLTKSATGVALTLAGLLAALASAADDTTNVAVVNGVPIPQSRVDFVIKAQAQQAQAQPGQPAPRDTPEFRQQIRDVLITREVLSQ